MKKSNSKVIRLREKPESEKIMEDIVKELRKGTLTDFIIIANRIPTEEEKEKNPDINYYLMRYWFGEDSCIKIFGLLQSMMFEVWEYVKTFNN